MSRFETKFERLEMKYLVDEDQACRIRRFIRPYCRGDVHNRPDADAEHRSGRRGYHISTLYLDSPSLDFHRARERGDADRLKLRVRGYRDSDIAALEIKRRVAETIEKTRVAVRAKEMEESVLGLASPIDSEIESRAVLTRFARIAASVGAQPTLLLRYEREAFDGEFDDYARVTFDRQIAAKRVQSWSLSEDSDDPRQWTAFDDHWLDLRNGPPVVLELKCRNTIPHWMSDLVGAEDLARQNFSKYSIGIHLTARADGLDEWAVRSSRNAGLSFAGPSHRLEAYDPFAREGPYALDPRSHRG